MRDIEADDTRGGLRSEPTPVTVVALEVGGIGGMERQLLELVNGLLSSGHRVTVIARECRAQQSPRLEWAKVRCPSRPFPLMYLCFFILGSLKLRRIRRGVVHTTGAIVFNHADVSTVHHCHHAVGATKGALSMSRTTLPHRLSARLSHFMKRLAERYCYRATVTSYLVGDSQGVVREIKQYFPTMASRVSVIPLGVDLDEFQRDETIRLKIRSSLKLSETDCVALFVGGDWERKGLRYAIQAIAVTEGVHLLVIGSGDTPRLAATAQKLGIGHRVHFIGRPASTAAYYGASDVFLLPSAYETFSLPTYEAAAAGLPLLVTHVSGVEEILENEINGWFITRNSLSISNFLERLKNDSNLRKSMGSMSRVHAARHRWIDMVRAYAALYDELAQMRGRQALSEKAFS